MEIREVRVEELEEAINIGRQAFGHGTRNGNSWFHNPNCPEFKMLGVWDAAGMQARITVFDYRVHLGSEAIGRMGGVGGVACLPASRGKGYTGSCLQIALQHMKENGQVLSSLSPFSWEFYRKYGWEWVGLSRSYSVPSNILTSHPATANGRAATTSDRQAIEACYTQFAKRYRGMLARDQKKWNHILSDTEKRHIYTYLYEKDGQVEGYMVIRGGNSDETNLQDFLTLTPSARYGMLGLLRRQEMQSKKFTWNAPGNDPLFHQLCHVSVETKLAPTVQGRIVDVQGALFAWKPTATARGAVNIAVQDEFADWNVGVWRVEFESGQVAARRTDAAAQISLSIQALAQAYYGTPSVDEIRENDHLHVHDEAGFDTMRTLFSGPPMWTYDSF